MQPFDARIAELASRQYMMFTRRQALDAGVPPAAIDNRIRSGRWLVVGRGIYALPGIRRSWHQRLMAKVLLSGRAAAATGRSGAVLWGIPGFGPGPIEVARPRSGHRGAETSVPFQTRIIADIPVTTAARMFADLSPSIDIRRLARSVDNGLGMRIVTLEQLAGEVRPGRRGGAKLRAVLAERFGDYHPPHGPFNADLLDFLRTRGFPLPDCEVVIGDDHGRIRQVDMLYRQAKLVLEGDSARHHRSLLDFDNDKERDARLVAAGFSVFPVTTKDLYLRPDVLEVRLRQALALRRPG